MKAWIHFCVGVTLVTTPDQTLREQVRLGASEIAIHNQYAPARTLGELVRESHLIVRGVVTSGGPHVMDEKIVTDFSVQVLDSIRSRGNENVEGTIITVRQPGGTVIVDGKTITAADNQFPALVESEEYVLLLSRISRGVYAASRGSQSVFRVKDDRVTQLPSAFGRWRGPDGKDLSTEEFKQLILREPPAR